MSDANNFQRIGSISNAHAGSDFEEIAQKYFLAQGISLMRNFAVDVGVDDTKKRHNFDLGSGDPPILVECKSHTWTHSGNVPSAKITVWNEATYYFHVAPRQFRKVLFVLKHSRRNMSLAAYYLASYGHLVPKNVEIWEYDDAIGNAQRLR